jgi:hypothetical protein
MNELENSLPELDWDSFRPDSEAIISRIIAVNGSYIKVRILKTSSDFLI